MFGLGFPELLIILVIILVIFGAGKLPQVGDALGKGLNKFRTAMDDKSEKSEAINSTASEASTPSENEKTEKKVDKV
ncbi:MAG: twin-arginine translocase TatA/TatE family subunit [Zetaproteobacteria bacterium]|nr:MAG: twin-arginine translocase TatA/TatE family subunit [Zetaproteobacteria bacterium]